MASYSAGRDIAAELISEPSTGTNLLIAATDQIRPTATTMAIAMDVLRMCFPSACVELGEIGLTYFSRPECEALHRNAKFFEARAEEGKNNGNEAIRSAAGTTPPLEPLRAPRRRERLLARATFAAAVKTLPGAKITLPNRAHHRKDVAGGRLTGW